VNRGWVVQGLDGGLEVGSGCRRWPIIVLRLEVEQKMNHWDVNVAERLSSDFTYELMSLSASLILFLTSAAR